MGPELAANFQQANQRLSRWKQLKGKLPQAQEQLTREDYQLRQVEHQLAAVEDRLHQLESFSLGGLISSLLGRKESEIGGLRERAERLRAEMESAAKALTAADDAVRQIEEQLKALGDPQQAMASLMRDVETQLLQEQGAGTGELADLNAQLAFSCGQRRELQKAVQVGKHLIERLHNMTNSLGRTQQKLIFGSPLGAVGNAALNAAAWHGMGAMVQRARDGFMEFGRCMKSLDLSEGAELDMEIAKVADNIEGLQANLAGDFDGKYFCDPAASRPFLDMVQTAIGYLEDKLDRAAEAVTRLEKEKAKCIERAMDGLVFTTPPGHSERSEKSPAL